MKKIGFINKLKKPQEISGVDKKSCRSVAKNYTTSILYFYLWTHIGSVSKMMMSICCISIIAAVANIPQRKVLYE